NAFSPEDEARVAARRILEDPHRRCVALVPAGDWGERVLAAFRQELLSGGGELLATAAIDASRTDYSGPITELLGLSDSTARFKRLEAAIGTKQDRKSTRLNSSHVSISYAVFCLKKKILPTTTIT